MGRGRKEAGGYLIPCRRCGKLFRREELSKKKLCPKCQISVVLENVKALETKSGEYYERWKAGMLRFAMQHLGVVDNARRSKKKKKD